MKGPWKSPLVSVFWGSQTQLPTGASWESIKPGQLDCHVVGSAEVCSQLEIALPPKVFFFKGGHMDNQSKHVLLFSSPSLVPSSAPCTSLPCPVPQEADLWGCMASPRLPCPLTSGWAWFVGGPATGGQEERGWGICCLSVPAAGIRDGGFPIVAPARPH